MLGLGKKLAKLGAHDSEDLESQDVTDNEEGEHHDGADLDVELDETAASFPVEAAPSVEEADLAASAEETADDLATEGAVEGDDGVLLIGEDGSLDADLGDDSGDAEEESGEDGEDDSGEEADGKAHPLTVGVLLEVLLIKLVQTEKDGHAASQVQADVGHGGGDGSGRGQRLPV